LKLNTEDLLGGIEDGAAEPSSTSKEGKQDYDDTAERDEGCAVEDDHEEEEGDDESHPWRNEGLRHGSPSDDESQDKVGASLGNPQQREGTWSETSGST
jgi:hypothetical protein